MLNFFTGLELTPLESLSLHLCQHPFHKLKFLLMISLQLTGWELKSRGLLRFITFMYSE